MNSQKTRRTTLVTCASRGLGAAIAVELEAIPAQVAVTIKAEARIHQAVRQGQMHADMAVERTQQY